MFASAASHQCFLFDAIACESGGFSFLSQLLSVIYGYVYICSRQLLGSLWAPEWLLRPLGCRVITCLVFDMWKGERKWNAENHISNLQCLPLLSKGEAVQKVREKRERIRWLQWYSVLGGD